jgi:hypothetical protein
VKHRRPPPSPDELLKSLRHYNAILDRLGVPVVVTATEAETMPLPNLRDVVTATADKVTHVTHQLKGLL